MVHYESQTQQFEREDRVETAVIGLRYIGAKSSVSPSTPRRQGGWPGQAVFQGGEPTATDEEGRVTARDPGPIQVGLNPDWLDDSVDGGSLPGLEALPEFEVLYDPEPIAEAFLEANYLPTVVFGSPPEADAESRVSPEFEVREAVFDHLGLEDVGSGPGSHETYREQLAAIAGIDLGSDEAPADSGRTQQYLDEHTRATLKAACERLREDSDDIALNSAKLDFAEWLATQDRQAVDEALAAVTNDDE